MNELDSVAWARPLAFYGVRGAWGSSNGRAEGLAYLSHRRTELMCAISSRLCLRACATAARAATLKRPCFHRALRLRSSPSGVRGPVLRPPWRRHRRRPRHLGALHIAPFRVFAPHLGASASFPGLFPFFSQPLAMRLPPSSNSTPALTGARCGRNQGRRAHGDATAEGPRGRKRSIVHGA